MRAVVQRVSHAEVRVAGVVTGAIDTGLMVLLGVTHDDTVALAHRLAAKIHVLRILRDEQSLADSGGAALIVSQFTLYGDTHKGRRPSWTAAAPGHLAEPLYDAFCAELVRLGVPVQRGVFGAQMEILLTNDGPTTLILDV